MGKYFSRLKKAVRGLEKKENAVFLLNRREFFSSKHLKKMMLISLNRLIQVKKKDGKMVFKQQTIYSTVSEVEMLKKVAELLKGEGGDKDDG